MDDKQLLEAIRGIVQQEVSSQVNGLREEMTGEFSRVRADMTSLREELTGQNRETRILIENSTKRIENLLREDYGRVADAAAKGAAAADRQDEIKSTVSDHDHALQNHNKRITDLEKKAM